MNTIYNEMKSVYIKELHRYTKNEISDLIVNFSNYLLMQEYL